MTERSPFDDEIRAHLANMLDAAHAREAERNPYIVEDPAATLRTARESLALLDAVDLHELPADAAVAFSRVLRDSLGAVYHVERVISPDGGEA